MIDHTTTILLAQRVGDWGDIIVLLVIVAASVFGAAGKWIAKQINEKREREAQLRRGGDPLVVSPKSSTRPPLEVAKPLPPRPVPGEANVPPLASPFPPSVRRVLERIQTSSGDAPTMDRVLEVILERATGVKIEQKAAPPAAPPTRVRSAPRPPAIARKAPSVPQSARPTTIAEREQLKAKQLAEKRTGAEREATRMTEREQQFTRNTDQHLGYVGTHIEAFLRDDVAGEFEITPQADLFDRVSIQDAIVLSEILAPPLALREPIGLSC